MAAFNNFFWLLVLFNSIVKQKKREIHNMWQDTNCLPSVSTLKPLNFNKEMVMTLSPVPC
jgi:hypothetical protein